MVGRRGDRTGACRDARPNWATKWKRLPLPGSLSSQSRPPISSTSCAEIVRPRPVPPYRRVVDASACTNAPKISHCLSCGDADAGVAHREPHGTSSSLRSIDSDLDHDLALSVNLMALPTRFRMICRRRPGSPTSASGHVGRDAARELQPLLIGARREQLDAVFDRVAEVERRAVEREAARLDLRDVEDVVDDRQQRLGRSLAVRM